MYSGSKDREAQFFKIGQKLGLSRSFVEDEGA